MQEHLQGDALVHNIHPDTHMQTNQLRLLMPLNMPRPLGAQIQHTNSTVHTGITLFK